MEEVATLVYLFNILTYNTVTSLSNEEKSVIWLQDLSFETHNCNYRSWVQIDEKRILILIKCLKLHEELKLQF